jgi:hypothetical protein
MWTKINYYINNLPKNVLIKLDVECQKYNTDYKNTFIYGFSTYISFFMLMSNSHFINLLPFTFDIPCSFDDGDCCDYNIMHYLAMPFHTIVSIIDKNCLLYHYINNILNFIYLWSDAFYVGPLLNYNLLNKLNYDTIKGVSQYSISKIDKHINEVKELNTKYIKELISEEIKSSLKELVSQELESFRNKSVEDSFDDNLLVSKQQSLKFEDELSFYDDYENERQPVLTLKKHIY